MADKHAVVRTDLLDGTDVRAALVSVVYMGTGETATDIDNGNVVKIEKLMEGEREIWKGVTPAAEDTLEDIVLIASPELMYDERKKALEDFYNEAGKPARGYRLRHGNVFSVTAEGLAGSPALDAKICIAAGTKLEATGEGTEIGSIIAKEETRARTYWVIKIN